MRGLRPRKLSQEDLVRVRPTQIIEKPMKNGARISWGAAAPQTPRNAGGAKAPPDPPFKSAFGLRSSLAIASSLARYRELQKAGGGCRPPRTFPANYEGAPPPQTPPRFTG